MVTPLSFSVIPSSIPASATNLTLPEAGFFVLQRRANLYSHRDAHRFRSVGKSQLRHQNRSWPARRLGDECARLKLGNRCAIITDTNVGKRFAKPAFESLLKAGFSPSLIVVPAGETAKSLKSLQACYDQLAATGWSGNPSSSRLAAESSVIWRGSSRPRICAASPSCRRRRPLLAQVDSSVGGKVGVNLKAGKNLVGAFYQPRLVLCDLDTLKTLPMREYRAGLAEVIKYGIICDAALFDGWSAICRNS